MNYKEEVNTRFITTCEQIITQGLAKNKAQLADALGIKSAKFSEILSGRMRAGVSEIQILCNKFGVSFSYLFNDEGDVFLNQNATPIFDTYLSAQNINLSPQLVHPIPEIERGVKRIDLEAFTETASGGIPLIPIDAAAGFLSGVGVQIMEYECERYQIPGFKGAEFLIRISGDSMTPKYESGDIVACQRLETDTFLQWNKVYVVDSEQGVLIKRIKPGRTDDTLTLISDNAEYAPFEMERRQVYSLGRVVGLIRIE